MDGEEILRLVEVLHKSKDIEEDVVFEAIESALASAARKILGQGHEIMISIDRETGSITALDGDESIDPSELGRIAAQTAKQVILQRIRESERDVIFAEYELRVGSLVSGMVRRVEGSTIIVGLERAEAILPRSEQISGEFYHSGDRIRAMIIDVRKVGSRVRIVLSRTHPDLVRRLFEIEVPEIAEGVVSIVAISREPGLHTKVAVMSKDERIDCVGACVGVRGTRIKNITEELGGEKVDIVRWSDAPEMLIANTLRPAEVYSIELIEDGEHRRARVSVPNDQLSRAIGKRGQNVRLASKLSKWEIDIVPAVTEEEAEAAEAAAAAEAETAEAEAAKATETGEGSEVAEAAEDSQLAEETAAPEAAGEQVGDSDTTAEGARDAAETAEPAEADQGEPVADEPSADESHGELSTQVGGSQLQEASMDGSPAKNGTEQAGSNG